MLFSQRMGIKPLKTVIQIDSMDLDLRNGLWNCLSLHCWNNIYDANYYDTSSWKIRDLVKILWLDYFKSPIDQIPIRWSNIFVIIKKFFFQAEWNEVYDFIEFIVQNQNDHANGQFSFACNDILKREVSAYRFIQEKIVKISSEEEISAIEEALSKATPLKPVYQHLKTALDFLSNRTNPDYRNSIKESISAVEAICKLIVEIPKATLVEAVKKLKDNKVEIHPALEQAFLKMYAYTSNESGIRHALMDEPDLKFIDAKFMLVSCSAFINLLIDKSAEAGIKFLK